MQLVAPFRYGERLESRAEQRAVYSDLCRRHNESKKIEGVFNWDSRTGGILNMPSQAHLEDDK